MPSLIDSGVSPFHQIGAGSETSTVSWPAFAGLASAIEPFGPTTSQLPILSPAEAVADSTTAADKATDPAKTARSTVRMVMKPLLVGCRGAGVSTSSKGSAL